MHALAIKLLKKSAIEKIEQKKYEKLIFDHVCVRSHFYLTIKHITK